MNVTINIYGDVHIHCDCCDGADCGDCCDCTPDYGGGKKRTTMSELSAPSEGPKKYL